MCQHARGRHKFWRSSCRNRSALDCVTEVRWGMTDAGHAHSALVCGLNTWLSHLQWISLIPSMVSFSLSMHLSEKVCLKLTWAEIYTCMYIYPLSYYLNNQTSGHRIPQPMYRKALNLWLYFNSPSLISIVFVYILEVTQICKPKKFKLQPA